MENSTFLWLALTALLLPLLSFGLLSLLGKALPRKGDWLSTAFTGLSFLATLPLLFHFFGSGAGVEALRFDVTWFQVGNSSIQASMMLDRLSVFMLSLVSFISLLVHIYSIDYMRGDKRYHRYWPYLSFFIFAMQGLVLSGNLLLTYIGWELVGLASYLMIGFWRERPKAALASQKAFIVNRIGDLGFLAALMALFSLAGSFDIVTLIRELGAGSAGITGAAAGASSSILTGVDSAGLSGATTDIRLYIAAGGMLLAAFAKSAQFPLHSWLPDAMEGPTAVSSLIHAATMVAAGVFLMARMFPLFPAPLLDIITITGTFTAFFAATVAIVQYDIKKVLAYSTISQLGFMMLAIGTGNYPAALFHLLTHAFFKCLLFLGAGAVIHHIHEVKHHHQLEIGEQDMRIMGGLRKELPLTFWVYSMAAAALAGLPFFSGFLSKELILTSAFHWAAEKGPAAILVPLTAVLTSLLTAWYIGRQWTLVFMGKPRTRALEHVRETGIALRAPMAVLALFTLFICFSWNPFASSGIPFVEALSGNAGVLSGAASGNSADIASGHVTSDSAASTAAALGAAAPHPAWLTWGLLLLALLALPLVIYRAYRRFSGPRALQPVAHPFVNFLQQGWYLDAVYNAIFVRPLLWTGKLLHAFDKQAVDRLPGLLESGTRLLSRLSAWFDKFIVDGLVGLIAGRARALGDFFRGFQTGRVQQYMGLAIVGLMILYLIKIVLDK